MHFILKMTDSVGTEIIRVFHSFVEAKQGFIEEFSECMPEDADLVKERFFGSEPSVCVDSTENIVIDGDFSFTYDFRVKRDDATQTFEFFMCSTPNGGCGCGCGSSYEIEAQILHVL